MIKSATNINMAVDKVSKIIFALNSFSHVGQSGEMIRTVLREGIEIVLTIYKK